MSRSTIKKRVLYEPGSSKKLFRLFMDDSFRQNIRKGIICGKAEDIVNDRMCFLKLAQKNDDETGQRNAVINLRREGQFQFCYPFIERVYGTFNAQMSLNGKTEHLFGVSVEVVEGMDLCNLWKTQGSVLRTDDGEKKIFRNMLQFLYGVRYYLHFDNPIYLHRDIKPENVMIDLNGNVKIVDFDFAHISGSTGTADRKHPMGFTRGYASPEVDPKRVDIQTEFYSIGRLFFFWLIGKHYYGADESSGDFENMLYVINPDLGFGTKIERYPEKYRADEYRKFRRFLDKLCGSPNSERYRTIDDVIEDFLDALQERYNLTTRRQLEELLGTDDFPILSKKTESNEDTAPNVACKIGRGSFDGQPLEQYMMRDIKVGDKTAMMIYNIDNEIFYIPLDGTKRAKNREKEDYRIVSGDVFVTEDGTEFKFKY